MKNPVLRKALIKDLEEAAAEIAVQHGLSSRYVRGTYDESSFTLKIEFYDKEKKAKMANTLVAPVLGLPDDVVGSSFKHGGLTYTVTALKPRNPKNCVILACENGKQYKTSVKGYNQMAKRG